MVPFIATKIVNVLTDDWRVGSNKSISILIEPLILAGLSLVEKFQDVKMLCQNLEVTTPPYYQGITGTTVLQIDSKFPDNTLTISPGASHLKPPIMSFIGLEGWFLEKSGRR